MQEVLVGRRREPGRRLLVHRPQRDGERTWETRSQVVAAVRGHEFAFTVGGDRTRWGYRFEAVDGGTKVTESWEVLPGSVAVFKERYGDNAEAEMANRLETAKAGIHATLSAIKKAAEAA